MRDDGEKGEHGLCTASIVMIGISYDVLSLSTLRISKGRVDKLANTIEGDADFLAFQQQLQQPVEKRPSAEVQLEAKEKLAAIAQAAEEAFVKKETAKLKVLASKKMKGRGGSTRAERAIRLAVAASLANKQSAKAIKVDLQLRFVVAPSTYITMFISFLIIMLCMFS